MRTRFCALCRSTRHLLPGAHNAIRSCLRIQPREKITLITDRACSEIAASLASELDARSLRYQAWVLEDLAPRPLQEMPAAILDDMETSDVSIFAVKAQPNELPTRMQMTDVVNRRKMRHAHMVNIDRRIMLEGMRADFEEVDRITHPGLADGQRSAGDPRHQSRRHRHRRPLLAALEMAQDQRHHQPAQVGQPARRRNLHHSRASRRHVRDRWRGGRLPLREIWRPARDAADHPAWKTAACGKPTRANKELEEEFWRYCHTDENSDRVGEFAIGTNIAVHDVIGNILQDEKIPGIHIAFGNPYGAHTGADWYSSTHIDVVGRKFDIWIDGRQIMRAGTFLL